MRPLAILAGIAAAIAVLTSAAAAHDFWLRAAPAEPEPGDPVSLLIEIGHGGQAEPFPYKPDHARRFVVIGPDGAVAAPLSSPGRSPAGIWKPEASGVHIAIYRGHPQQITLEPAKFESYLAEEGLDGIIAERRERGESGKDGVESYSRAAKAIIVAGRSAADGFDLVAGMDLELVPLDDPSALEGNGQIRLRLLWRGEPLAGARVDASRLDETGRAHGRTGEDGVVRLPVTGDGRVWLFTSTHMERASGGDADWSSVWASLTCVVGAR